VEAGEEEEVGVLPELVVHVVVPAHLGGRGDDRHAVADGLGESLSSLDEGGLVRHARNHTLSLDALARSRLSFPHFLPAPEPSPDAERRCLMNGSGTGSGVQRRDVLRHSALGAVSLSTAGPLLAPRPLSAQGKRGGILRVRGYDPPHFDPHLTLNFKMSTTVSFVYNKLVRFKPGPGVAPNVFTLEPDLAERWEQPDDTTYVFHLRKGVHWHNVPPLNGRELIAEDVKFTYTRFLTVKGNPERYLLDSVDRVDAMDRYTVKFTLGEPYVWLPHKLANALCMWIVAPELVEKYGDLKRPETAIGTGPFTLERYDRNVKAVFKKNPQYFRPGQPSVDGADGIVSEDGSPGPASYRTAHIDAGPATWWSVRQSDLDALKKTHPQLAYQDFLGNMVYAISLRTDQPPFTDVRVRRAISRAIDRRALIDAVWMRGEPSGP